MDADCGILLDWLRTSWTPRSPSVITADSFLTGFEYRPAPSLPVVTSDGFLLAAEALVRRFVSFDFSTPVAAAGLVGGGGRPERFAQREETNAGASNVGIGKMLWLIGVGALSGTYPIISSPIRPFPKIGV